MREYNDVMAILTREYFDKKFGAIDKKFEGADRNLKFLEKNLKAYTDVKFEEAKKHADQQFDDLNMRVANGFRDIQERLDVKARIENLERNYEKIREALNLNA